MSKKILSAIAVVGLVATSVGFAAYSGQKEQAPCCACCTNCVCTDCQCDALGCACDTGGGCVCSAACCGSCCAK